MKSLIQVVVSLFALVSVPIRGLFNLTDITLVLTVNARDISFRPHQGII